MDTLQFHSFSIISLAFEHLLRCKDSTKFDTLTG